MARIKHQTFRSVTHVIGSHIVEFDAEGTAEVDLATAKSVSGIPGFSIVREPAKPVQIEPEPVVEEPEPEPVVEESKEKPARTKKGRKYKR